MMNDHDHDYDLIMRMAQGESFDAAAGAEAEACSECAADLAAQRVALEALAMLHDASDASLTELESARLMRDLDRELGHRRTEVARAPARRERRWSWAPAFGVAAVLLALLLVAPALNLLGGSTEDSGGDFDVALDSTADEAATTAAPAEEDMTAAAEAPEALVESTLAAAADGAGTDFDVTAIRNGLVEVLQLLEDAGGDPARVASTLGTIDFYSFARSAPLDACEEEGALAVEGDVESRTLGDLVLDDSGRLFTVTAHTLSTGDLALVAHDRVTCEVIAVAP